MKEPTEFFHKFDQNLPTGYFVKEPTRFSINCSEYAQLHIHWVLFDVLSINSQFTQFYNKLSKNPLSIWLSKVW